MPLDVYVGHVIICLLGQTFLQFLCMFSMATSICVNWSNEKLVRKFDYTKNNVEQINITSNKYIWRGMQTHYKNESFETGIEIYHVLCLFYLQ